MCIVAAAVRSGHDVSDDELLTLVPEDLDRVLG